MSETEPLASRIRPREFTEFVGQQHLVGKGKPLLVIGEPSIREYTDSSGNKRQSFDVRVRDVVLLGDGGHRDQQPPTAQQDSAPAQGSDDTIPF